MRNDIAIKILKKCRDKNEYSKGSEWPIRLVTEGLWLAERTNEPIESTKYTYIPYEEIKSINVTAPNLYGYMGRRVDFAFSLTIDCGSNSYSFDWSPDRLTDFIDSHVRGDFLSYEETAKQIAKFNLLDDLLKIKDTFMKEITECSGV